MRRISLSSSSARACADAVDSGPRIFAHRHVCCGGAGSISHLLLVRSAGREIDPMETALLEGVFDSLLLIRCQPDLFWTARGSRQQVPGARPGAHFHRVPQVHGWRSGAGRLRGQTRTASSRTLHVLRPLISSLLSPVFRCNWLQRRRNASESSRSTRASNWRSGHLSGHLVRSGRPVVDDAGQLHSANQAGGDSHCPTLHCQTAADDTRRKGAKFGFALLAPVPHGLPETRQRTVEVFQPQNGTPGSRERALRGCARARLLPVRRSAVTSR